MNFYEISIQKFLEHLENIDKSTNEIAMALIYIAYTLYSHDGGTRSYNNWVQSWISNDNLSAKTKY